MTSVNRKFRAELKLSFFFQICHFKYTYLVHITRLPTVAHTPKMAVCACLVYGLGQIHGFWIFACLVYGLMVFGLYGTHKIRIFGISD